MEQVEGIDIMINALNKSNNPGTFTLSSGRDVYGELTLRGRNTSVNLQDRDSFDQHELSGKSLKGVLHDSTKVTLLQCVPLSFFRHQGGYTVASIFPHYVVHGDSHINPAERKIIAVHFVVDDAATLFNDITAFGFLKDARPFIKQIVQANGFQHEIATGPNPEILYFCGKHEIFVADTVLGRVSASHDPILSHGGPDGIWLKNTIFVTIAFSESVNFKKAIDRTSILLRYMGILVGRQQNLVDLHINIESDNEQPVPLQVYWSMSPKREQSKEGRGPHPSGILIDAVHDPAVFSSILTKWLEREQDWHDARLRFYGSFIKQQTYSIDRLIRSANMFDILPSSAVPSNIELSEELESAKKDCQIIFTKLPRSPERDSVLSALGRVGRSVLKHKIRHRGQLLLDALGERFPDLFMVTDEAVNCRNHYIHGSDPSFDYSSDFVTVDFFMDTLEFVFATSDLIEAGWDVKEWSKSDTKVFHSFVRYLNNYADNLQKLKNLIL